MRALPAFILWLIVGAAYFFISSKYCCDTSSKEESTIVSETTTLVKQPNQELALSFSDGKDSAYVGKNFESFKKEKLALIGEDQILAIIGYYHPEEVNKTTFPNLGIARAEATRIALGLSPEQVKLLSFESSAYRTKEGRFESVGFSTVSKTNSSSPDKIVIIGNDILIYFPTNSANYLEDTEINNYLSTVISSLKDGQKIELKGHTDSDGEENSNVNLGLKRANQVKSMLLNNGLSSQRILVKSFGESTPIETNETEEGKAKNRRVQLNIIN